MRTCHFFPGALALALCAACGDSVSPTPATHLLVRVEVIDSLGSPVRGVWVDWSLGPDVPPPTGTFDPAARTDVNGEFTVDAGTYETRTLDSLRVGILPPGCDQPVQDSLLTGVSLSAGDDTVVVRMVSDGVVPPATTTPGVVCSNVVDPVGGPWQRLGLRIDSVVGSQFYGRWVLVFQYTRGSDYGAFVGGYGPTFVTLHLVHDAPWGTCTGLDLAAPILQDGTWGTATITHPQGCLEGTQYFDFTEGQFSSTWP